MNTPAVITLVPVVSSNIAAIGYHAPSRTLEVQFKNGSRYQYQNVMVPDYEALIHAESIGSWFSQKIKALPDTFPCTKVHGPVAPDVSGTPLRTDSNLVLDNLTILLENVESELRGLLLRQEQYRARVRAEMTRVGLNGYHNDVAFVTIADDAALRVEFRALVS